MVMGITYSLQISLEQIAIFTTIDMYIDLCSLTFKNKFTYYFQWFFLWTPQGFLQHNHIICEKHQFYLFSNLCAFILFSHLFVLGKTSRIMMNRSVENSYPFYIPDLRENTFNSSPVSRRLTMEFLQMPIVRSRKFPSIFSLMRVCCFCFFSHEVC